MGLNRSDAIGRILTEVPTEHTRHIVDFVERSKRGICGLSREGGVLQLAE